MQSAFFDVRVCHPNADSYRELSPKQIFQLHENEKRQYGEHARHRGVRTQFLSGAYSVLNSVKI